MIKCGYFVDFGFGVGIEGCAFTQLETGNGIVGIGQRAGDVQEHLMFGRSNVHRQVAFDLVDVADAHRFGSVYFLLFNLIKIELIES